MRIRRSGFAALYVVAMVAGGCGRAPAAAAAPDTLHLHEVLALVAANSRFVHASNAAVLHARAEAGMASSVLDPSVQLEAEAVRVDALRNPLRGSGMPWVQTYRATVVQGTPWGISIGPYAEYVVGVPVADAFASRVGLSISAPLLRLGSRNAAAQAMEAAEHVVRASLHQRSHVLSQELLQATLAYWDLYAERERLDILTDAAARAAEVHRIVALLVAGGERAASDRLQAEAFAADRERERRFAEQQVWERLARLATVSGVSIGVLIGRPLAGLHQMPSLPETSGRAVARGLARREDLRAGEQRVQAARILRQSLRRDMKPQIRLVTSYGQDVNMGSMTNAAGRVASIRLQISSTAFRRSARAALQMQLAREREQEAIHAYRLSEAQAGLHAALTSVANSQDELQSAERAREAHERAVASERAKLEAGFATVYDVILVEDRLTGARLSEQIARARFAQALARLAYESGSLVGEGKESALDWAKRMQQGGNRTQQ